MLSIIPFFQQPWHNKWKLTLMYPSSFTMSVKKRLHNYNTTLQRLRTYTRESEWHYPYHGSITRPRVAFAHAWCSVPVRLWHQLTQSILEFFEQPESTPHQIPIFQQFIAEWESKINKLSLVQIALRAASNCTRKYDTKGWVDVSCTQ